MIRLYIVCFCVLVVLAATTVYIRKESSSFFGLADTKEITVNSESSVEIKRIRITPGQLVKQGDTIVELTSHDLDLRINEISHELAELKTRSAAHVNMTRAEIRQLMVLQDEKVNAIKSQIQPMEAQYELNKKLLSGLKSIKPSEMVKENKNDSTSPVAIQIENLKKQLEKAVDSSQIQVDRLRKELSYQGDPIADQIRRLTEELKMLTEEKRKLFIVSQINGIIGAVYFKDGEKVSPFTPIITLHTESPSFISGYINEITYSSIQLGQTVRIQSLAQEGTTLTGVVTGIGSKIVEYPIRLRRLPEVQMWGREIIIKIPEQNKFLLGEKVIISPLQKKSFLNGIFRADFLKHIPSSTVYAEEQPISGPKILSESPIVDITSSIKLKKGVEASGVLFLRDLRKYLIVSDETKQKAPLLFLMDSIGVIDKQVTIQGLDRINDMESITGDGQGNIYILSSQSSNKKGMFPESRKLFIRVRRSGESFTLNGSVSLIEMLNEAARKAPEKPWAQFIVSTEKDGFEIEGMFYDKGNIYIGFKKPMLHDTAVIMAINNIDHVFKNNAMTSDDILLWEKIDLKNPEDSITYRITDMCHQSGYIYLTSTASIKQTGNKKYVGMLWAYNILNKKLTPLRHFENSRPEGIAYNDGNKSLCVTFDNGSEHTSQMMILKVLL